MSQPQIAAPAGLGTLDEPTPEERMLAEHLFLTGGGRPETLLRVKAVRNPVLDSCLEMCRQRLASMGAPAEEVTVFHGTTRQASGSIIRSGFDASLSGSAHGQVHGAGIYAGLRVATAHAFTVSDSQGEKHMFICRALPGAKRHHGGSRDVLVLRREQQIAPQFLVTIRPD